jgi:hypothetical protein
MFLRLSKKNYKLKENYRQICSNFRVLEPLYHWKRRVRKHLNGNKFYLRNKSPFSILNKVLFFQSPAKQWTSPTRTSSNNNTFLTPHYNCKSEKPPILTDPKVSLGILDGWGAINTKICYSRSTNTAYSLDLVSFGLISTLFRYTNNLKVRLY